jgi:hypothetical protein
MGPPKQGEGEWSLRPSKVSTLAGTAALIRGGQDGVLGLRGGAIARHCWQESSKARRKFEMVSSVPLTL